MVCAGIELITLTVQLIVDLPANYSGMLSIVLRQCFNDAGTQCTVDGRIVGIVSPATVAQENPIL